MLGTFLPYFAVRSMQHNLCIINGNHRSADATIQPPYTIFQKYFFYFFIFGDETGESCVTQIFHISE